MLDGLDEAPDRVTRETLSRLIENAAHHYEGCRFIVTSRPPAYTDGAVLPDFSHARIDPLSDEAVRDFLSRWCGALYGDHHAAAREHCNELLRALELRPDIREMVRNPVMLTALAVVHWNEQRLPEQRAAL
jgi:predicted NACHT family NTPase